ncbi:hypothetical protein [Ruminococcus sp.]|uniref:hypothetical protein n=1 Tax=Ruminococcus sp. TaxID=41978 RepID=UPI002E7988C4|nr:hypothetical protein [Ruminococcus sp.]MEE1396882.1 hypothetical protein [Ruminococcus sp.]
MKSHFLGLDCYETEEYPTLIANPEIKGLVIGDLFCENRMFRNGRMDMLGAVDTIAAIGKAIVFQCPVYVTFRNMEDVRFLLQYIQTKHLKTYVIVHDLGMVNLISREFNDFNMIWGRMARFRDYVLNRDFLCLLKSLGICGIELCGIQYRSMAEECGLTPYIVYGWSGYVTIGRQCYHQYQGLGCNRETCLSGRYSMHDAESSFQMTINGYMMGERFVAIEENLLSESDPAEQMVYASNIEAYYQLKEVPYGTDL